MLWQPIPEGAGVPSVLRPKVLTGGEERKDQGMGSRFSMALSCSQV